MTKPKHVLKNMRVMEVSLVDEGDNPHADVVIMKRRQLDAAAALDSFAEAVAKVNELALGEGGDEGVGTATAILKGLNMNIEDLNEKLGEIEGALDTVTKAKDEAEARVSELEAEVEKLRGERDEAVAKAAPAETDEDEVLKGLPEPIRKRLEAAEAKANAAEEAIAKARDERELGEAVAKAKELGADGDEAEALGKVFHAIAKGKTTEAELTVITDLITKAKALATAGNALFEEIGKSAGGQADDAKAKLDAATAEIMKAKPGITREAAYVEALDANPALYDEVRKAK